MANKIYSNVGYTSRSQSKVGTNSAAFAGWDFVQLSGWFVAVAWTSWKIEGIANGTKTFASDNQTVAKEKLSYTKFDDEVTVETSITWGTVTAADEGKYYSLSTQNIVDGTTESTTSWQLRLVTYVSATKGRFGIGNAV